jgi:heme/copper-type cytochrome/quinol oxidase subunit 3
VPVLDLEVRPPDGRASDRAPGRGQRPPAPPAHHDGNGDGEPRPSSDGLPLSNARLGMLMLLGGETMFFGGLVIAFLQLRLGAPVWPPPGQPRLPLGLTAVNTLILLASSWALVRALRAVRSGDHASLWRWLSWTWGLGALFLVIQGIEWTRLVHFGLRVSSGIYGATFYTLIGVHGLHVLGAVVWLTVIAGLARQGRFTRTRHVALTCCAMYWHYVVGLWPVLYLLVYLA